MEGGGLLVRAVVRTGQKVGNASGTGTRRLNREVGGKGRESAGTGGGARMGRESETVTGTVTATVTEIESRGGRLRNVGNAEKGSQAREREAPDGTGMTDSTDWPTWPVSPTDMRRSETLAAPSALQTQLKNLPRPRRKLRPLPLQK